MDWFERGLVENRHRLFRYAYRLKRNRDAAEDLVQDVLVRALEKRHLFERGTDLRAWLFCLVHNCNANDVRKAVRRGLEVEPSDAIPSRRRDADVTVFAREIDGSMGLLQPDMMSALRAIAIDEMTYQAAAKRFAVPVGTVRSRVSRGRQMIRALA